LLEANLLKIKSTIDLHVKEASMTDAETDGEDDDVAVGTFLTREDGAATFYGPGARAEARALQYHYQVFR
jgi:hypothetical protein